MKPYRVVNLLLGPGLFTLDVKTRTATFVADSGQTVIITKVGIMHRGTPGEWAMEERSDKSAKRRKALEACGFDERLNASPWLTINGANGQLVHRREETAHVDPLNPGDDDAALEAAKVKKAAPPVDGRQAELFK
jgi:hypothetical protein